MHVFFFLFIAFYIYLISIFNLYIIYTYPRVNNKKRRGDDDVYKTIFFSKITSKNMFIIIFTKRSVYFYFQILNYSYTDIFINYLKLLGFIYIRTILFYLVSV